MGLKNVPVFVTKFNEIIYCVSGTFYLLAKCRFGGGDWLGTYECKKWVVYLYIGEFFLLFDEKVFVMLGLVIG